jgi:hypothetical protein
MGCSVTRESGCTGLLATFDSSGELQTKGPTESSDGPAFPRLQIAFWGEPSGGIGAGSLAVLNRAGVIRGKRPLPGWRSLLSPLLRDLFTIRR